MKFLVDANPPFKLAKLLKERGHDVIHTDDLPDKEKTKDNEIREISESQNRVVITKDLDFLDSHLINRIPGKFLLITIGNIVNKSLIRLFEEYFDTIIDLFSSYDLIELNNDQIIGHEK